MEYLTQNIKYTRRPKVWSVLSTLTIVELMSFCIVAVCIFLMLFGPYVSPYPPEIPHPEERLLQPSPVHWFGTDENGMDVLSRIIASPRVDIYIGLLATLLSVLVGVPLGVIAGVFEGSNKKLASFLGEGILRLLDVIQAFPVFILALVLVAIRGASVTNILVAIAFVNSPVFLRLAREEILSLRERPFAEAARSIGNSDIAIAFKHLLPNALPPLLSQLSVTVGFAILLTSGLSFVGAGVEPPTPELGGMIATGAKSMILGYWWPSLFPGLALGLIVFTFSVTGEALGRILEPGSVSKKATKPLDQFLASTSVIKPEIHATSSAKTTTKSILTVSGLTVDFVQGEQHSYRRVLNDVSLSISRGEFVGVIGGPGAGKSTLVRSILLLQSSDAVIRGEILFRDKNLLTITAEEFRQLRGKEIAHILPGAKAQLNPLIRVGDFMTSVIRVHKKISKAEAKEIAMEALRTVGITDPKQRLEAYPHELSGGMAQRVCIALALIHRPNLIIADEPTFGLDVTVQRQVLDLMTNLAHNYGFAQLLVTRDLGIIAQYCQRVFVMEGGRIVEGGNTLELLSNPTQPYTRQLVTSVKINKEVVRCENEAIINWKR